MQFLNKTIHSFAPECGVVPPHDWVSNAVSKLQDEFFFCELLYFG